MHPLRLLAALAATLAAGGALVSGSDGTDPRTPPALPGQPKPFLGTALAGSGGLTEAIDTYGTIVDLRAPGPAGEPLLEIPSERQSAGTLPSDSGIVVSAGLGADSPRPLWRATAVKQSYLPRTSVVRTEARLEGGGSVQILDAVSPGEEALARRIVVKALRDKPVHLRLVVPLLDGASCTTDRSPPRAAAVRPEPLSPSVHSWSARGTFRIALTCAFDGGRPPPPSLIFRRAARSDRTWLTQSMPLGNDAPGWARDMYERSLLVLRALTDRRTGAVAAGARDGWAFVWPRDAATVALALRASGHRLAATRIAEFLGGLDLDSGARFDSAGHAAPGRPAQGDAEGWLQIAQTAGGFVVADRPAAWRGRADYGERAGDDGDYLANAIAAGVGPQRIRREFAARDGGLVRIGGQPSSGPDTAVAWAVRPFPNPALEPEVRASLRRLLARRGRFGLAPSLDWPGGPEPWSAPTAWVAWSLAALGERSRAIDLLGRLRAAATPAGDLPERVDDRSGLPESTTPLAWSHAFAVLALRELWPSR